MVLVEDLGAEFVVYFSIAGQSLVTLLAAAGNAAPELGSRFPFTVQPGGAALFDPATGRRLGQLPAAAAVHA